MRKKYNQLLLYIAIILSYLFSSLALWFVLIEFLQNSFCCAMLTLVGVILFVLIIFEYMYYPSMIKYMAYEKRRRRKR